MTSTLAAVGVIVAAVSGLASLALILRFLWLVYDRGGAAHLMPAAAALRQVYDPTWLDKLTRFLPDAVGYDEPGNQDDEAGPDDGPDDTTSAARLTQRRT